MPEVNMKDPELMKALRRIKSENQSDPWIVNRTIAHMRNGILSYEDVVGKKQTHDAEE